MKREKVSTPIAEKNNYFTSEKKNIQFISTGCTLLDCALGGGYVLGRIANVVGDKSTAKTALATEALINFLVKHPNGVAAYRETEAAYDPLYAEAMGLPIDKIDFGDPDKPLATVEDFERDLTAFIEHLAPKKTPGIYIVDSLDALSDEAEMQREVGEATYGGNKAKQLSTMFRKLARRVEASNVLVIVISQVRDNIGAMMGEKHKRSGGRALDFYATHIIWLAHLGTLTRTIKKVKRPYGVEIRAKVKKNKISMPFRQCDFNFIFGFGTDDIGASLAWLEEVGRLDSIGVTSTGLKKYIEDIDSMEKDDYAAEAAKIRTAVIKEWRTVEESFLPKRSKYA